MNKYLILISSIVFSLSIGYCQTVSYNWARKFAGSGTEDGISIVVDGLGNVFSVGVFQGATDFDPGPSNYFLTPTGFGGTYVSKLSSTGTFVWARQFSGTSNTYVSDIELDATGNVYVFGSFTGTTDFDPGAGTYTLASAGSSDIYICKLNSSGNFIWARNLGGVGSEGASSFKLDPLGNLYLSGTFAFTADFDPGTGTFNLTSAGVEDIFFCKLDNSGNFAWAVRMGAAGTDYPSGIDVDPSGNIYACGQFSATVDFDPGPGTYNLSSIGNRDGFITK